MNRGGCIWGQIFDITVTCKRGIRSLEQIENILVQYVSKDYGTETLFQLDYILKKEEF